MEQEIEEEMEYNKETENYYIEIKECPICFEQLDICGNIILLLDCCRQEIHLECMKNWILNPQNTEKNKCILCRTSSDLIIDIGAPLLYENQSANATNRELWENNTDITDISDNLNNNNNFSNNFTNTFDIHNRINFVLNNNRRKYLIIFNIGCFCLVIGSIFIILFVTCRNSHC